MVWNTKHCFCLPFDDFREVAEKLLCGFFLWYMFLRQGVQYPMAVPLKVNTTPLIFILSPGTDPVSDVIRFAEQLLGRRMPQMEDAWTLCKCNKQKSLVRLVSMGRIWWYMAQRVAPNVRTAPRCQGWNGQKVWANLIRVAHSAKCKSCWSSDHERSLLVFKPEISKVCHYWSMDILDHCCSLKYQTSHSDVRWRIYDWSTKAGPGSKSTKPHWSSAADWRCDSREGFVECSKDKKIFGQGGIQYTVYTMYNVYTMDRNTGYPAWMLTLQKPCGFVEQPMSRLLQPI